MKAILPCIVLAGHPNVGKSRLFNLLTGSQVAVSNYPGTTVELVRGKAKIDGREVEVIDSPGLYSLSAISAEEQVTRLMLLRKKPDLVIQVIDARNLRRMLSLTLELIEAELPLVVVLNMMDEAAAAGLGIDAGLLSRRLGVPVVPAALVTRRGLKQVRRQMATLLWARRVDAVRLTPPQYSHSVELMLQGVESRLKASYGLSRRAVALAILQPDPSLVNEISKREGAPVTGMKSRLQSKNILLPVSAARRSCSDQLLRGVVRHPAREMFSLSEKLGRLLLNPIAGTMVLGLVLYFGFYRFVGGFGAGILVEFLDERLFLGILAPSLNRWAEIYLPQLWLRELLVLDYGILTLGLRYTMAIILPIMATFFLLFGLIEDSGYLPRAAYLANSIMEKIGLNGKAIIPLTLGLGCGTLAVMATRTLENRRERLQAALLLSLAIPCSAQLGLIISLLAGSGSLPVWLLVVALFFFGGSLAGRVLFGREATPFCLEIPPLRLPRPGAIFAKTAARMRWYLREILPLFAAISVLIWLLNITGLMGLLVAWLNPAALSMGLPGETTLVLVLGFLRRDYGAAGLYDMVRSGLLAPAQILTAAVVLTLFLPCIAQLTVLFREHGAGFAFQVIIITALVAWLAGVAVYCLTNIPVISNMLG